MTVRAVPSKSHSLQKAERESAAVRALFGLLFPDAQPVRITYPDPPDAIADLADGSSVAIEVVETTDQRLAHGYALLNDLRREVDRRLRDAGCAGLVHIRTRDGFVADPGGRALVGRNAVAIEALAREHWREGRAPRAYDYATLRARGIERLTEVRIGPLDELLVLTGLQLRHGGGLVGRTVQSAIDGKNAKLAAYRRQAQGRPVWLLVLAGTSFASGTQSDVVREETYVSRFDRTFYIDAYDGVAFELRGDRPIA